MSLSYFNAPIRVPNQTSLSLEDSTNSNIVSIRSNTQVLQSEYIIQLPPNVGSSNQVLQIQSILGNVCDLTWGTISAGNVPADDITTGDAAVNITTSVGDITLGAPLNSNIALQVNSVNALFLDTTGANVGGTLDVTGVTNLNATTTSTSTTTGALIVDGGVGIAENVNVGANLSVSKKFIVGVDTLTVLGSLDTSRINLFNGSNAASVKHIDLNNASTLFGNVGAGVAGETLNLFFDNDLSGSANIDFTTNGLYAGSGLSQYLVFTNSGQSASLIYVGGVWRIINTGATVA